MNAAQQKEIEERIKHYIDNKVYVNQSYLVEKLLETGIINYEEIENAYEYPEWSVRLLGENLRFDGGTEDDKEEFKENFERLREESESLYDAKEISEETHNSNLSLIEEAEQEFDFIESEPQEIFEWWAVSGWLAEKLSEIGAPVMRSDYGDWWGRTTTGCALGMGDDLAKLVRSQFTTQEGDAQ